MGTHQRTGDRTLPNSADHDRVSGHVGVYGVRHGRRLPERDPQARDPAHSESTEPGAAGLNQATGVVLRASTPRHLRRGQPQIGSAHWDFTFSTILAAFDSTRLFSPQWSFPRILNLAVSTRPPLCANDGRRWPVGRLKPRAIASNNEDGRGGCEKATTLPPQVATHFSFRYRHNPASQPATEADIGGLPLPSY